MGGNATTGSDPADLRRMAATIQAFSRGFGAGARDGRILELPGVVASVAPAIGFRSIFNAAAYTDVGALERALPTLRSAFDDAGVVAWGVWAHESDRRAAELLGGAGLRLDSSPTAMAARVRDVAPPDRGAIVERARDLVELDRVLAAAYEFPPGVMVHCFPGLLESFDCLIARDENGEPVAALATADQDGDCGVTLVGTDPAARGRGFAAALMCHAIAAAAQRGCTTTTLQATAMGRSLYARLGYRELGVFQLWEHRVPGA